MIQWTMRQAFRKADESGELLSIHPLLLEAADRTRRELKLKEEMLELAKVRAESLLRSAALRDRRMANALDEIQGKMADGNVTAEDIRRIRDIYGLYDDPPPEPLDPGNPRLLAAAVDADPASEGDTD